MLNNLLHQSSCDTPCSHFRLLNAGLNDSWSYRDLVVISSCAFCGLLWLPVLYYAWLPAVYFGYLKSTMATCSLLIATWSLLWQPVVYYGYTYSLSSVLSSLLYSATLLYLYLVFIITASVLLCLHYLVNLPMLLSALLTNSCIPCLVCVWLSSVLCISSLQSFL